MASEIYSPFDNVVSDKELVEADALSINQTIDLTISCYFSYEIFRRFCAEYGNYSFGYDLAIRTPTGDQHIAYLSNYTGDGAMRYFDMYDKYGLNYVLYKAKYRSEYTTLNSCEGEAGTELNYLSSSRYYLLSGYTYEKLNTGVFNGRYSFSNIKINTPNVEGTFPLVLRVIKSSTTPIEVLAEHVLSTNIKIYQPDLKEIVLNTTNATLEFNQNAAFNTVGLSVRADYQAHFSKIYTGSRYVTNYTHNQVDTTTSGDKTVTVSFSDKGITKTASYQVNVVGVSSYLFDTPTKTSFVINDQLSGYPQKVVVTYTNGETATINLSLANFTYSFVTVGRSSVVANVVDPRTNTTIPYLYPVSVLFEPGDIHIYSLELVDFGGISFNQGATLSLDGVEVSLVLSDGTTDTGTITGTTVNWDSGAVSNITDGHPLKIGDTVDTKTTITNNLTINYGGLAGTTNNFTIDCIYLNSIQITSNPTKVSYFVGETIDYSGIVVKKTMKNTENGNTTITIIPVEDLTFSRSEELPFSVADGDQTIQIGVSYSGLVGYFNVVVTGIKLTSLTYTGSPKTSYIEGQHFDIQNLVVTANYNNGDTEDVSDYRIFVGTSESEAVEISKTQLLDLTYSSRKKIFISYGGITAQLSGIELSIAAKELESIVELEGEFDLDFIVGTPINFGTLTAKVVFDNDFEDTIDKTNLSYSYNGTTINEGDVFGVDDVDDDLTITISYTYADVTKTITAPMSISMPEVVGISATISNIDKQLVVGTTCDLTSILLVKPVYENGLTTDEEIDDYSFTGVTFLDNSNLVIKPYGSKSFTVTYQEFSTTVEVTIIPNSSVEVLAVSAENAIFRAGDLFDKSLLDVSAIYVGENEAVKIFDFETIPANGSLLKSPGIKEIIVSAGNKTTKISINVLGISDSGYTETSLYKMAFGDQAGNLFTSFEKDGETISLDLLLGESGNVISGKVLLFNSNSVTVDTNSSHQTYGMNVATVSSEQAIGYVVLGTTGKENAHVVLFEDPVNPIEGDGNMIAKFPHYVPGYADKINKCKFGVIYNKRLFVSGNENFKNCDWHTSPINIAQVNNADYDLNSGLDFTYFSDLDYCNYGSDDTAVVGYAPFRDGDLIVVKESSRNEATIYRRSATTISAIDYSGSKINGQVEEGYPMFDVNGNGGEGGINNRSVVDFVGDSLMLTRSGLKAILNKENLNNNAKYTVDVSTFINPLLKNELDGAFLFPYKEELYLSTSRGVYVGYYANRNEDNEYEWYFLEGFKPRMFFEYDGSIYFGQEDGKIGRYNAIYEDENRTYVGDGGVTLSVNMSTDEITTVDASAIVSNEYKDHIVEGNDFHLISKYSTSTNLVDGMFEIHGGLGWFINSNTKKNTTLYEDTKYVGEFYLDEDTDTWYLELDINRLDDLTKEYFDKRKVFLDKTNSPQYIGKEYELIRVSPDRFVFKLQDYERHNISLEGEEFFRLSYRVSNLEKSTIYDVNEEGNTFKLKDNFGEPIDLIKYNDIDATYSGVITKYDDVEAYFLTKPYDMGSIAYMKNVWSFMVSNDTNLASEMDIGYMASRKQGIIDNVVGARQVDFGHFNLGSMHFINDKLPSIYTNRRPIPSIGFIRFLFKNSADTNMVLTKLSVIYTVGAETKGVK